MSEPGARIPAPACALLAGMLASVASGALSASTGVLVASATIRPPSDDVEVRVEVALPAQASAAVDLRALPLDGTRIARLQASIDGAPVEARSLDVSSSGTADLQLPRELEWQVRLPQGLGDRSSTAPAARRLRLVYVVEWAVRLDSDRLDAVIPVVVPRDPALASAFEAHVSVPAEWSVYAAFPSELAGRRGDDLHSVSLPTPTSVLRIEARRGGAPLVTLGRGLDALALTVLGAVLVIGGLRLRREAARR
ncbi:MAG TPA: hypothetical protein VMT85_13815 [Thermoanaerobaculia bacterium]|nr:hypothetical protein [Thermoanaerobaculia bacterium]